MPKTQAMDSPSFESQANFPRTDWPNRAATLRWAALRQSGPDPQAQVLMAAESADKPTVELYTDGACRGNPGPGGWAYILKHPSTGSEREGSGGETPTTNNRMELLAVVEGLNQLKKPSRVTLFTDSQYVSKGLSEWMRGWKAKGWRLRDGKPVKNADLWKRLDELIAQHEMRYQWVRGHAGHPENERCDVLAVAAAEALR